MRLEIGSVVNRSYRLLHPIGEGGTARVWVAEQLALERRVAIKILSDETIQSPATLELFQREALATARVDHPHVVRIVDFGISEEGAPFLVFELLVGETLEQRLKRGAIDLDEARSVLAQTCDALAFAHERSVLHRDIKAENLFLQQARAGGIDVKLLDFGIATRKSAQLSGYMRIAGTPAYMSPEQLEGSTVDERCDLFALGVCIYYALTKHFPYPAETAAEARRSFSIGTFVPMSMLRSDIPMAFDDWFEKALAIDPRARFADARTMFTAFERARQVSHDAMAVDLSSMPPKRPLPWGKIAAALGVAIVGFAHVTPPVRLPSIARASIPIAAPTPAHVVATPPPVLELPPSPEELQVQAVPVEALPKTPAPSRAIWYPPAAKPQTAKRTDASADPIPEFGGRE